MPEFTGERVVPGLVDDDLFNEHMARYRFAARLAARFPSPPFVLDAGCGTGYGSAELSSAAASVVAVDISTEAIQHARSHFPRANTRYAQASCETLPFSPASFDLVCAFEVIEHLERWEELLAAARRVLKPAGLLLISTPNKAYYAEARAEAGPNPFHTHEFEYEEFRACLSAVFPHVELWSQNHADSIVFTPADPSHAELDAAADAHPERAHFFFAVCGSHPLAWRDTYAWIPFTGNVLREREHHIAKLEGELAQKNDWLEARAREHSRLQAAHEVTLLELRERNQWALEQDERLAEARAIISGLRAEAEDRLAWIGDLESSIARGRAEIERLNRHREDLERDLAERAEWGFSLDAQVKALSAASQELNARISQMEREREAVAASKWMRLGRKLNLGPRLG